MAYDQLFEQQGSPDVLKEITFQVESSQKIGIVGRTGAGKSSLLTALFRFCEISKGSITIDGIDTSKVNLEVLRSRIGIIPQDPLLFTGTIRDNLDFKNDFSDQEIWDILRMLGFDEKVQKLAKKLNHPVSEGGDNFSVGERQMFCLARALLLKKNRERHNGQFILVLDEATASVDYETDKVIQQVLRDQCKNQTTILVIAHRIETVLDSDKILFLDAGQVAEFDSPLTLLQTEDSKFRKMVESSGNLDQYFEIAQTFQTKKL